MRRVQRHDKKGYITANAILLALFIILIVQMTMQNLTTVTYQSRLFQSTEQDKLDVKSGIYREIANVVANPLYTSSQHLITLGNGAKVYVSTSNVGSENSNTEKQITSKKEKGNLQLTVNIFKVPEGNWIIYRWAWEP